MEMLQLNVPMLLGASMLTLSNVLEEALTLPKVGATWHQAWFVEALQLEVVLPVLERVTDWGGGVTLPETPLKARVLGARFRWEAGTGLLTVTWADAEVEPAALVAVMK